jgi:hypothetical protein
MSDGQESPEEFSIKENSSIRSFSIDEVIKFPKPLRIKIAKAIWNL